MHAQNTWKRSFNGALAVLLLIGCLGVTQTAGCQQGSTGVQIGQRSCPVATMSTVAPVLTNDHAAVMPSLDELIIAAIVILSATLFAPPRAINGPAMRQRRRFLHAILPRHGPQNQRGRYCYITPQRDP